MMGKKDGIGREEAEDGGRIPCQPRDSVCFVHLPQAVRFSGAVIPGSAGPTGKAH
jgi:hypothetical protein